MGARRVGYFVGLVIMIFGIILVPLGLIFMFGGIFESLQTGSANMLSGGLFMVISGTLMFVVGLVSAVVLKKTDGGQVNISINAANGVIQANQDSRPLLKVDEDMPLEPEESIPLEKKQSGQELVDNSELLQPKEQAESVKEEISMLDMVKDLQDAKIGDMPRLNYIENRLNDGRTVYNSDKEWVRRKFEELRAKITKED